MQNALPQASTCHPSPRGGVFLAAANNCDEKWQQHGVGQSLVHWRGDDKVKPTLHFKYIQGFALEPNHDQRRVTSNLKSHHCWNMALHMSDGLKPITFRERTWLKWSSFFVCSPMVPEGLVLVDMIWASDWKEAVAEAESSRTSSSKRKSSSSSNEKGIVSYQQGSHFGALSVGMCL